MDTFKMSLVEKDKVEEEVVEVEATPLAMRWARLSRIRDDEGATEYAARLFASGMFLEAAAEKAGISERRLRDFLHTDTGKEVVRGVHEELDEEFKALYFDTVQELRLLIHDAKPEIRTSAINTFLRYAKELRVTLDITAEDLVQKIMKGGE